MARSTLVCRDSKNRVTTASGGQPLRLASDSLPALEVPAHSRDKEYYFETFIRMFSRGMKRRWTYRTYIDLFCGPGKCVVEETGEEFSGSALVAATVPDPFTHYFFGDLSATSLSALKKRLDVLGLKASIWTEAGDANVLAPRVHKILPGGRSLDLAVIDPWGWEFSFDSIRRLTEGRQMDLILMFSDGNIRRFWQNDAVLDKFAGFVGGRGFADRLRRDMETRNPQVIRNVLNYFRENLLTIGYEYVDDHTAMTNSKNRVQYHLVFASRHQKGLEFWQKARVRTRTGKRLLPGF